MGVGVKMIGDKWQADGVKKKKKMGEVKLMHIQNLLSASGSSELSEEEEH